MTYVGSTGATVEIVNSFSQQEKPQRDNKLFSRLGWWLGTSQFLSGLCAFILIFGLDYIKVKFGFDIMSMFGPNAKNLIIISGFTTLLSGIVLMPPTLKMLRANYPFMNNLYAAPSLALVLGLVGVFVLKSPDLLPKGAQDMNVTAQKTIEQPQTPTQIAQVQQNEKLEEEEKIQLRGTYYAR